MLSRGNEIVFEPSSLGTAAKITAIGNSSNSFLDYLYVVRNHKQRIHRRIDIYKFCSNIVCVSSADAAVH